MPLYACIKCGKTSPQPHCATHKPRNRPRGNAYQPLRQAIAERDNWTCQLCGKPINPRLRKPHPDALHIDHIHPFTDGGTENPTNLRSTHARCNLSRTS